MAEKKIVTVIKFNYFPNTKSIFHDCNVYVFSEMRLTNSGLLGKFVLYLQNGDSHQSVTDRNVIKLTRQISI